jgi:hypothetical protein
VTVNNILIIIGITLLTSICIVGSPSSSVMSQPGKSSYWCVPITDGYTVKCCDIFGDKKYCTVCADTNPPSNCTPREEVREDSNNQDTTIPPTSGAEVEDDSNNDNTVPTIPPTSGAEVEDDANSGENTGPRIPTKGDGLSTLDGDKVLSPSP